MGKKKGYPLGTFMKEFGTEKKCGEYLANLRWPDEFVCPKCGCRHAFLLSNGRYQCAECRRQTSVTAGTVLHRTPMPLTQRFLAFCFASQDKRGISAVALMSMQERAIKPHGICSCVSVPLWASGTRPIGSMGSLNLTTPALAGRRLERSGGGVRKRQRFLRLYPWVSGEIPSMPRCGSRGISSGPQSKSLPRPRLPKAARFTAMVTGAISRLWRASPMSTSPTIPIRVCSIGCTS